MKFHKRDSIYTNLKQYCHLAKPDEIIDVCEWVNGEGWDISIGDRQFMLSIGELEAITVLTKVAKPEE